MIYRQYSYMQAASLLDKDRKKCVVISNIIIVECVVIFLGSATILRCTWNPDFATADFDKLARIMYLYDSGACGHIMKKAKAVVNIQFSNETFGLPILPIKWQPALVTISTRLSAKTIQYIQLSLGFHVTWMILAIALHVFTRHSVSINIISFFLALFFYGSISIIFFDVSMAIVYATHITQSLTKGMVLRYSGWSGRIKLDSVNDFAGWLPMAAAICWIKGIIVLGVNVYCCKVMYGVRKKIQRREATKHILMEGNQPIPEAMSSHLRDKDALIFRSGESHPYVNNSYF